MRFEGLVFICANKAIEIDYKSVSVECEVCDYIANVSAKLTYVNSRENAAEAIYSLPLNPNSAVYHFEADIEGRKILGKCMERAEARETYEVAVESGRTAALFESSEESADIFKCSLGNVPAKATVIVTFKYVLELSEISQETDYKKLTGRFTQHQLTLPTVLKPRYNTTETHKDVGALPKDYSFHCNVVSSKPLRAVTSALDTFSIKYKNKKKTKALVEIQKFKAPLHDIEMVVQYSKEFEPYVLHELGSGSQQGTLLNLDDNLGPLFQADVVMLNFCPKIKKSANPNTSNTEYIFVVDRSGSMSGSCIKQAGEALLIFLKSLPSNCRFQIVGFGTNFKSLFPSTREYNEESLKEAVAYQQSLKADMGTTNVLRPLQYIYNDHVTQGYIRNIFFVTDGDVGNVQECVSLVKKYSKTTRMFALGIGSGASMDLVEGVARAGNGRSEFVRDSSQISSRVVSLMKGSMQPVLKDVGLSWTLPDGVQAIQIPSLVRPVFGNTILTMFALLEGDLCKLDARDVKASVTLSGKLGDDYVTFKLPLNRSKGHFSPDYLLRRLAVKYQISQMSEVNDTRNIDTKSIVFLSTQANIATKWTSFVAVDTEGNSMKQPKLNRTTEQGQVQGQFEGTTIISGRKSE